MFFGSIVELVIVAALLAMLLATPAATASYPPRTARVVNTVRAISRSAALVSAAVLLLLSLLTTWTGVESGTDVVGKLQASFGMLLAFSFIALVTLLISSRVRPKGLTHKGHMS